MGVVGMVAFGTIFSSAALLMVALSFSTDHWLEYTFARAALKETVADGTAVSPAVLNESLYSDPRMFTRYRGLFRTCYPGSETIFLDSMPGVIDGHCLPEMGYELIAPLESTVNFPAEYTMRKHLLRTHFAMFVASMLTYVIACISGGIGCWQVSKRALLTAGIISFVGAFFTAGGMAVFHGYEYLEKQVINLSVFPKGWTALISNNTSLTYGWSYIVGWLGMSMAVVAAILYLCAAYSVVASKCGKYKEKRPLDDYHLHSPHYHLDGAADVRYHHDRPVPHFAHPYEQHGEYGGYRY